MGRIPDRSGAPEQWGKRTPMVPMEGSARWRPARILLQARLGLNVTAANRVDLLPGGYRIEINGVTVWVPGPWVLSFSLSGQ